MQIYITHPIKSRRCARFCHSAQRQFAAIYGQKDGYALPSVLFLIVILTTVAFSVLSLLYFQWVTASTDIQRVQADYAAQNGIATFLSDANPQMVPGQTVSYDFKEFGRADLCIKRWGALWLIESQGSVGKKKAQRIALVGTKPDKEFGDALIFANPTHQLVLSGTSHIKGNVIIGLPGVSTGRLKDLIAPTAIPIEGTVKKELQPRLPYFRSSELFEEISGYDKLLREMNAASEHGLNFSSSVPLHVMGGMIPDDADYIFITGDVVFETSLVRRELPLHLVVHGKVALTEKSRLEGFIKLLATDGIVVAAGTHTDVAILYSKKSIELRESATISGQLVAPYIELKSRAVAKYPSVLVSISTERPESSSDKRQIVLHDGVIVKGTLLSLLDKESDGSSVIIHPGAKVTGIIYSNGSITLDGLVEGAVMTKDFYFFEAPTKYLGWLRGGTIDRATLPPEYLLPAGFGEQPILEVLDWL